jgi:hypothetical protein
MAILDTSDVIDWDGSPWYWLRIVVSVVWAVAGAIWAIAEYRRRH